MTRSNRIYALSAAAVAAAALIVGIFAYRERTDIPDWTFAFYLDGSGSLLLEQQRNLREIIQGSRGLQQGNVIVYLDRGPAPKAPMFYAWKGPRVFQVTGAYKDTLTHPVQPGLPRSVEKRRFVDLLLKGLSADNARLFERHYTLRRGRYVLTSKASAPDQEQSMMSALLKSGYLSDPNAPSETVSPESMSRFFSLVRDNYPARHYAFFIAGHGLGWFSGRSMHPSPQGAETNPGQNKSFNAEVIQRGLIHNEPDILCLDLCLMADVESLYRLRHSADYLVMGQGPLPSGGQDYEYLFRSILAENAARPEAMARAVFASSAHALDKSRLNSAVSLIKTGPAIDTFITDFAHMLSSAGAKRIADLHEGSYTRLPSWGGLAQEMIDLKSFIAAAQQETGTKGPQPSAFLISTHSTSKKISGLSIYYPRDTKIYQMTRDEYAGLDFLQASGEVWQKILDMKHGRSHD